MLSFSTDLDGEEGLERAIDEAMRSASDGIRNAVAEGLQAGAEHARRTHPYHDQTGKLTASVGARLEVSTPGGAVGVIEARAPYAKWVEGGTRAHEITTRRARALHWEDAGGEHFARHVNHPGTKPLPFIEPAGQVAAAHIERSIELDLLLNLERIFQD